MNDEFERWQKIEELADRLVAEMKEREKKIEKKQWVYQMLRVWRKDKEDSMK